MKRLAHFYYILVVLIGIIVVVFGLVPRMDPKDVRDLRAGDRKSGSVFGKDTLNFRLSGIDNKTNITKFTFTTGKSGNFGAKMTVQNKEATIIQLPSQYPLIAKNDKESDSLTFEGSLCPIGSRNDSYDVTITMSQDIVGADVARYNLNVTEYQADLTDTNPDHGLLGKLAGNGADYYFIDVSQRMMDEDKQINVFVKRLNPVDVPPQSPQYFAANVPEQRECPNLRVRPQCSITYEATLGNAYPGDFYFDANLKISTNIPIQDGWKISWVLTDPHEKFVACPTCDVSSIESSQSGRIVSLFNTQAYQGSFGTKTPRNFGLRFVNKNYKGKHIAPNRWTLNGFPCSINKTQVCTRNPNFKVIECNQDLADEEKNSVELMVNAGSDIVRRVLNAFGMHDYYRLDGGKSLQGTAIRVLEPKVAEIESIFRGRSIGSERNLDKSVTFAQNESTASFLRPLGSGPMRIDLKQTGRYYLAVTGPPAGFQSMEYRIAYCVGEDCDALSQYDDFSNYGLNDQIIDKETYCSEHPDEYLCQRADESAEISAAPSRIGMVSIVAAVLFSTLSYMFA